jgi:hypothetical protein
VKWFLASTDGKISILISGEPLFVFLHSMMFKAASGISLEKRSIPLFSLGHAPAGAKGGKALAGEKDGDGGSRKIGCTFTHYK